MSGEAGKEWLTVLMVAEKPSIAKTLALALGGGKSKERTGIAPRSPVHEYWGKFQGEDAFFRVTATQGHVYSFDFGEEYNDWAKHGPEELFAAPIVRTFDGAGRLPEHLAAEAQGCHALVLWLDCDREGENICFEVMQNVLPVLETSRTFKGAYRDRIFRAKFSSLRHQDLRKAMETLGVPNENEAQSVDARAEIDLRLGISFSRFQTQYFKRHFGAQLGSIVKTVSYGPCQMPTLWFCAHRHCQIQEFQPRPYWKLCVELKRQGDEFPAEATAGQMFDEEAANKLLEKVKGATEAKVTAMARRCVVKPRPLPLNTVAMLQRASERAGISPGDAMHCAENLYLKGITSYPRTETSRYPPGFDLAAVTHLLQAPGAPWAAHAAKIAAEPTPPRTDGVDHGDHPPITPVKWASEQQCGDPGSWELYKLICEHFLGTIAPDCTLDTTEVQLDLAGVTLVAKSSRRKPGEYSWCEVLGETIKEEGPLDLAWVPNGSVCSVIKSELAQHYTKPPQHLSESDLLGLMERHGIGTDASMATHISNVQKRGYVRLEERTRQLIPAPLGLALAHAYTLVDPGLIRPTVRSAIENACAKVAKGEARKKEVVAKALGVFERKFKRFCRRVDRLPAMLAVAYSRERDAGTLDVGKDRDYTEEEWRNWAAKKKEENPEMGFTEEQWLDWLKEREANKKRWNTKHGGKHNRGGPDGAGGKDGAKDDGASNAGQESAKLAAISAATQWDMAARATAAVSLEELLRDRSSAELTEDDHSTPKGLRPGATVRIHGLKSAAELNGQTGTCSHLDSSTGRWHIKLPSGELKALKADNLEELVPPRLISGTAVVIKGLTGAAHLNGQEGICEQWDASKGRWAVRLPLGEVKALKPENLQEVEDEEDAATRNVARVQSELESLGFGAGYSLPVPVFTSPMQKKKWGSNENEDEAKPGDSGRGKQGPDRKGEGKGDKKGDGRGKQGDWKNDGGDWSKRKWGGEEDWKSGRWGKDGDDKDEAGKREDWPEAKRAKSDGGEDAKWKDWKPKWEEQHGAAGATRADEKAPHFVPPPARGGSAVPLVDAGSPGAQPHFVPPPRKPPSPQPAAGKPEAHTPPQKVVPPRLQPPLLQQQQPQLQPQHQQHPQPQQLVPPPPPPPRPDQLQAVPQAVQQLLLQVQQALQQLQVQQPPQLEQQQQLLLQLRQQLEVHLQQEEARLLQQLQAVQQEHAQVQSQVLQQQTVQQQMVQQTAAQQQLPLEQQQLLQQQLLQQQQAQVQHLQQQHLQQQEQVRVHLLQQLQLQQQELQQQLQYMEQSVLQPQAQVQPQQQQQPPPPPLPPQQQVPAQEQGQHQSQHQQMLEQQQLLQHQQMLRAQQARQRAPIFQRQQQQNSAVPSKPRPPNAPQQRQPQSQQTPEPCSEQRAELKKRVFKGCDKDADGYLDKEEMLSLAVLTGFDGSDDAWAVEYARLCKECNADRNIGIAQGTLLMLLEDQSDAGFYCTDKQLEEMCAALEALDEEGA